VVTVSLCVLIAIPMTGFARVDLWGGEHFFPQNPVNFASGMGGLLIAVLLLYAFTFLTNLVVGRFFCGWGCPVAYLNRLGENIEVARNSREVLKRNLAGAGFSPLRPALRYSGDVGGLSKSSVGRSRDDSIRSGDTPLTHPRSPSLPFGSDRLEEPGNPNRGGCHPADRDVDRRKVGDFAGDLSLLSIGYKPLFCGRSFQFGLQPNPLRTPARGFRFPGFNKILLWEGQ
jgi:hypothetical protein